MSTRRIVVVAFAVLCVSAVVLAQDPTEPITNWAAPPYWTPPATHHEGTAVRPAIEISAKSVPVKADSLTPSPKYPLTPITPCRLVDTRQSPDTPYLDNGGSGETREYHFDTTIPYAGTGACSLIPTAAALSLSIQFQVTDHNASLIAYSDDVTRPLVANVLAYNTGLFYMSSAIVPTGVDGGIKVFAQWGGQVVININGYYAPLLPYSGSASSGAGTDLFSIENTGGGNAIHGITTSGTALVADANGDGGVGIRATALVTGVAGYFNGWAGIVAYGGSSAGYFANANSSPTGSARLGAPGHGVEAYGTSYGGYFANSTAGPTGSATLGAPGTGGSFTGLSFGIKANGGSGTGGYFTGYTGVQAYGANYGGYFADSLSAPTGSAKLGYPGVGGHFGGTHGIEGYGSQYGGYFMGVAPSGIGIYANGGSGLAAHFEGGYGVEAYGSPAGYFADSTSGPTAWAKLACCVGHYGVQAHGQDRGGSFDGTSYGVYATAVAASSGIAGYFSGWAGVDAWGTGFGGYFVGTGTGTGIYATASSGLAGLFKGANGIQAWGSTAGGYGVYGYNSNTGTYSYLGKGTYKVYGSGSVSFVQNHPYDPTRVIVYSAPESDEVATYTRGSAHLVDGEARVALGETFAWVTNPDIGLTVYLTPVGDWADLYVAEKTTASIVVRSVHGPPDAAFDYIVWGLRIGFEEVSVVQEKEQNAYIPAMTTHEQLFLKHPDLRRFASLARYRTERAQVLGAKAQDLDLSASEKLKAAIGVFVPGVTTLDRDVKQGAAQGTNPPLNVAQKGVGTLENQVTAGPTDAGGGQLPVMRPVIDPGTDAYGRSFHSLQRELAYTVSVDDTVEPGDVLVAASDRPGILRRAASEGDPTVVGIVAAAPGVLLGGPADPTAAKPDRSQPAIGYADLAVSGIVRCKVDASYGPIRVGDLLVTSATPGHARVAKAPAPGTVVGKALEAIEAGTGAIEVLVMLR